jgi:Ca2+-binding EF-hand superfamily protein
VVWLSELAYLLRDLGERLLPGEIEEHFRAMDRNNDMVIDFDEFVVGMEKYIKVNLGLLRARGCGLFRNTVCV